MRCFVICLLITLIVLPPFLADLTPDSPLYPIKRLLEDLDLLLTFDDVSKAKKLLEYAKMRLIEAEKMAEKGEDVSGLLKDYESYIRRVVELMRTTDPKNVPKIAKMIVNESISNMKILDELSRSVGNIESVEEFTIKQDELAVKMLNSSSLVKEIEDIINEATNLSNAKKENLTTEILKKGLRILPFR